MSQQDPADATTPQGDPAATAAEDTDTPWRDGTQAPDAGHEDQAETAGQAGEGHASEDGRPGAAVMRLAPGMLPPRPPKRTGVFLDTEDLREHVGALLRAMLGGYEVDAWGNFTFAHEGARVFVTVGPSPIGPQVGVFSVTNLEIDLTPQLAAFLLTTNHRLGFGSFSYDSTNRAVWLRHSLLGTTLDGPELQSAVAAIASSAAGYDDAIRDRFGGRAFADASEDVRARTRPPETPMEAHPNASGYL